MSRVERRAAREARESDFVYADLERPVFFTEDTDAMSFNHERLEYDVQTASAKIAKAGLDKKFSKRLLVGQ